MSPRERGPLTEAMFYTLLALLGRDLCGTEIARQVEEKTRGRVRLGPGTLYTILGKFLEEELILETEVEGRRRTYSLTAKGREAFQMERERLAQCLQDAEEQL